MTMLQILEILIKFVICSGLVVVTIVVVLPINVIDILVGLVVTIFGGKWKFETLKAWNSILDHWSKGEFMF